jgi:hypothetical protein
MRNNFELELSNRFSTLRSESILTDINMQEYYDQLLESIENASIETLGVKTRTTQPNWVSEQTLQLIDKRDAAKRLLQLTPAKSSFKATRRAEWLELDRQVKSALQTEEVAFLEDQLEELKQANDKHEHAQAWRLIKKLAGSDTRSSVKVKSKKGVAVPERELLQEWRLHFENLLNNKEVNPDTYNTIPPPDQPPVVMQRIETGLFSRAEVEIAITALKNKKAPGSDQIVTAALLKNGGDSIVSKTLEICNAVYSGVTPPWQWTTNNIVPVPKKGDRSSMNNYRGISLMSCWAKLYNRLLLNRLRPVVDAILRNNQAGFRPGRSTIEQINALRRIIEGAKRNQLALVIIFVDFKKAFDSILRNAMFEILRLYGIPLEIINAIRQLYNNSKGVVSVNGKTSDPFDINTGVLQGDVLAPFLFVIVIDYIMRRSAGDYGFEYEQRQGSRRPAKKINDCDFADDIALLERFTSIANEQLRKLSEEARQVGLVINIDKTEYMTFNQPENQQQNIILDNQKLKQVTDFQYLGSRMSSSLIDFNRRRGLAWAAFWKLEKIWRAQHVLIGLKLKIFKVSVMSVFLYGCETWIITSAMADKINSFATSCYRVMLGIKRLDKVANAAVYERVGERPLIIAVQQRQLRWVGHALRREVAEPARIFALYEPAPTHGRVPRGRPPVSYKQYIASLLTSEHKDLTVEAIVTMAQDRREWGKRIADFGR